MLRGLPASIVLHAVAIGVAVLGLPYATSSLSTTDSISVPIELVDAGLFTDIAPIPESEAPVAEDAPPPEPVIEEPDLEPFLENIDTLPEIEPVEEIEISDPEPSLEPSESASDDIVPEIEPIEPDPLPEPEPEIEPVEEPVQQVEEDLIIPEPVEEPVEEPEPVEEEAPVEKAPEPARQAPPPDPLKDLLSSSRQSLGSSRTDRAAANTSGTRPRTRQLEDEVAAPRRGAGERERAIASFSDIIQTQMEFCWRDVVDLPNPERLIVVLKVNLNADGTLKSDPEVVSPRPVPVGDSFYRTAIDRAIDATVKCVPYQLPAEDYDLWQTLDFKVGPKAG